MQNYAISTKCLEYNTKIYLTECTSSQDFPTRKNVQQEPTKILSQKKITKQIGCDFHNQNILIAILSILCMEI